MRVREDGTVSFFIENRTVATTLSRTYFSERLKPRKTLNLSLVCIIFKMTIPTTLASAVGARQSERSTQRAPSDGQSQKHLLDLSNFQK